MTLMGKLKNDYMTAGREKLLKALSVKNIMAVPRLSKIVLNVGLGEALTNKKAVSAVSDQLTAISGQKPVITRARKDISTFKLRKGDVIGVKLTLRGLRMYDFMEKFTKIVLPRIRDFRGVPLSGFDKFGNYTLGLSEQIVFAEIEYDKIDKVRGLEISFVTTAKDPGQAKALLTELGIPFHKEGKKS